MNSPIKPLDSALIKKLLLQAAKRLEGKWALIGGTVLPALGVNYRSTIDVDLISLDGKQQTLKLMELAEDLGLPVETINSAGAYFLSKIEDHQSHWVELIRGPHCVIYRPDAFLYLKLKMGRMSSSDLSDCEAFLDLTHRLKEPVDSQSALKEIEKCIKKETDQAKKERLLKLSDKLKP